MFPFHDINNNKLYKCLGINKPKQIHNIPELETFCKTCKACNKKVLQPYNSIPCKNCKTFIHKKCSNLTKKEAKSSIQNWECPVCKAEKYPLTSIDNDDLFTLSFNSSHNCKCKNKNFKPLNNAMTLLLTISQEKDNEYTHTNDQNFENNATIKPNFKYYDIHDFHKMKDKINKPKTLSVFHSNICSLNANVENLEILLHDLDFRFDVITLTETWNPESKKEKFLPKKIDGYDPYIGTTGSLGMESM